MIGWLSLDAGASVDSWDDLERCMDSDSHAICSSSSS